MKKSWIKTASVFLLIVLMLFGMVITANGSSLVYLLSVNDTVMEMTPQNMPLISSNQLYIPYTMLSIQTTGVNLGVRAQYSTSRGTLTVTDGLQVVTFDTRKNTAYDAWGNAVDARALVRNSMVFIPIDWLCRHFDQLEYSLTYTPHGILVRLTSASVILTDTEFIDAADSLLRQNLKNYREALEEDPPPTQTASPSPTPTVPATKPPEAAFDVYLAFRWGSEAETIADILESSGQRALFLFTCKELMQQDDLVRRLIAKGHQIGLYLEGNDIDLCLEQLEYGRELMEAICRGTILIVSADEIPSSARGDRQALLDAGCVIWSARIDAEGMSWSTLSSKFRASVSNYVELPCTQESVAFLREAIPFLTGGTYRLIQVVAPKIM